MRVRIPRRACCLSAAIFIAVIAAACKPKNTQTYFSTPKPVSFSLDGSEVKVFEARFDSADLSFVQGEPDKILIDGEIVSGATDQRAADIQVTKLDLNVIHGRVTMIGLPAASNGFSHRAHLRITLPRNVNLRVTQGEGEVSGHLVLPFMTEIELGNGTVDLELPRNTAAFVAAEVNIAPPEEFVIKGFEKINGAPQFQLTRAAFEGLIGTPLQLVGSRLEVRVNSGACKIHAADL